MRPSTLTSIVLAGLLALTAIGPASAGPSDRDRPVVGDAAQTQAEQAAVARYWTQDRMERARVRDLSPQSPTGKPSNPGGGKGGGGNGGGDDGGGGGTGFQAVTGAAWTADFAGGGDVVDTTGKLYFTVGGLDYQCSASVVTSSAGNVALTAGHCVHDGAGGAFATNVQFIPAFADGARPHGTWIAKSLVTTTGWAQGVNGRYDFDNDVAFVVLNNGGSAGTSVQSAVGAQGIAFHRDRGQRMYSFGYPAERKYDGGDLIHCADDIVVSDPYGTQDQGMDCNMNGGSSGGPWFIDFDPSTGVGIANSVNSFTYRGIKDVMWGPYFGTAAQNAYNAALSNGGSNTTA